VAADGAVKFARTNAVTNQADASRRTCAECGEVFGSRAKLFRHLAANSTGCGGDSSDEDGAGSAGAQAAPVPPPTGRKARGFTKPPRFTRDLR
jgi:hypothetical protein